MIYDIIQKIIVSIKISNKMQICVASLQKGPQVAIYQSRETMSQSIVFDSIGQNYFTAFYVSKYCFASFYILFLKI